jgi:hypothetical protein
MMMNNMRYDHSWQEYYQEKEKEKEMTGLVRILAQADLSTFVELPSKYVDNLAVFKESVAQYSYGNCILIPVSNNQVRCIHSCFVFRDLGKPTEIVGILGSRRSPPFKLVNIYHAVKLLTEPRTTRTSGSAGDELWLPMMEQFLGCKNEEDFRDLTSAEEEYPASELWKRAQTFWFTQRYLNYCISTLPREPENSRSRS